MAEKKKKPFKGYNKKKHSRTGGLNDKERARINREEGSNLKRPVTGKVKAGSKAANRRKSFCARMSGVKGPTSKDGQLTPKGAALKRWKCRKSLQKSDMPPKAKLAAFLRDHIDNKLALKAAEPTITKSGELEKAISPEQQKENIRKQKELRNKQVVANLKKRPNSEDKKPFDWKNYTIASGPVDLNFDFFIDKDEDAMDTDYHHSDEYQDFLEENKFELPHTVAFKHKSQLGEWAANFTFEPHENGKNIRIIKTESRIGEHHQNKGLEEAAQKIAEEHYGKPLLTSKKTQPKSVPSKPEPTPAPASSKASHLRVVKSLNADKTGMSALMKALKQCACKKSDKLPGGKGDTKDISDFDAKEVEMGLKVEMEHTKDREVAQEIVADHLSEDPSYYSKLKGSGLADELEKAISPEQQKENIKKQRELQNRQVVSELKGKPHRGSSVPPPIPLFIPTKDSPGVPIYLKTHPDHDNLTNGNHVNFGEASLDEVFDAPAIAHVLHQAKSRGMSFGAPIYVGINKIKESKNSQLASAPASSKASRLRVVKSLEKAGRCWEGYEPTPGKKPYSKGSCRKIKKSISAEAIEAGQYQGEKLDSHHHNRLGNEYKGMAQKAHKMGDRKKAREFHDKALHHFKMADKLGFQEEEPLEKKISGKVAAGLTALAAGLGGDMSSKPQPRPAPQVVQAAPQPPPQPTAKPIPKEKYPDLGSHDAISMIESSGGKDIYHKYVDKDKTQRAVSRYGFLPSRVIELYARNPEFRASEVGKMVGKIVEPELSKFKANNFYDTAKFVKTTPKHIQKQLYEQINKITENPKHDKVIFDADRKHSIESLSHLTSNPIELEIMATHAHHNFWPNTESLYMKGGIGAVIKDARSKEGNYVKKLHQNLPEGHPVKKRIEQFLPKEVKPQPKPPVKKAPFHGS